MPGFRIETILDSHSGLIFAEVISDLGDQLIVRSEPMYQSHEEAEAEVIRVVQQAWPDRSPAAVDPSLGV